MNNKSPKRYYLASGLENFELVRALRNRLDALRWTCTFDWTQQGSSNNGSLSGAPLEVQAQAASLEILGVMSAEVVIVLLPGKGGTHVELGAAIAFGLIDASRRIIVVSFDETGPDEGMHFAPAATKRCMFYHHPRVTKLFGLPGDGLSFKIDDLMGMLEEIGLV